MLGRLPVAGFKKISALNYPIVSFNSFLTATGRCKSTKSNERVVITNDGSTVVCWHPEKPFPYEFSRPIPEEDITPSNTVLKVENKSELYKIIKSQDKGTVKEELAQLTYTTKHRWYPNNSRYRKTFKKIKSDREWL